MPDPKEMPVPDPKEMPVRFFGKAEDGSPCLLYDAFTMDIVSQIVKDVDSVTVAPRVYIGPEKTQYNLPTGSLIILTRENPDTEPYSTADLHGTGFYYYGRNGQLRKILFPIHPEN